MPEPINDPTLGRLAWDKEYRWWTGEVQLQPDRPVGLTVEADPDAADPEGVLAKARAWLDRIREREADYTAWTAARLIETRFNTDEPMTAADIVRLISVTAVECFPDGTACITWEDNEVLFFGHGIVTHLDAAGSCTRVVIE